MKEKVFQKTWVNFMIFPLLNPHELKYLFSLSNLNDFSFPYSFLELYELIFLELLIMNLTYNKYTKNYFCVSFTQLKGSYSALCGRLIQIFILKLDFLFRSFLLLFRKFCFSLFLFTRRLKMLLNIHSGRFGCLWRGWLIMW